MQEFELEAQFRCNGSDAFINWVDNTLGIRRTANVLWDADDPFEFRIVNSVEALEQTIRAKNSTGFSARLVAGFCWEWSDPMPNGTLVSDVVIGDWSMPWNAKPDSTRLAVGIPKSHYWSSDPAGIDQVGCVYTAQGFEFDYVGVIFGRDLRYDPATATWVGDKTVSHDGVVKKRSGVRFEDLVKNTYRVLLTRGLKGCYVYFVDEATKNFFASHIERRARPGDIVYYSPINSQNGSRHSRNLDNGVMREASKRCRNGMGEDNGTDQVVDISNCLTSIGDLCSIRHTKTDQGRNTSLDDDHQSKAAFGVQNQTAPTST